MCLLSFSFIAGLILFLYLGCEVKCHFVFLAVVLCLVADV